MKQKRTYVTLLLIIAILCLGIGYALIGNITLEIGGTVEASPDAANFVVKFKDKGTANVESGADAASAETTKVSDTKVTLTATGLTAKGDNVTGTWTIQNISPDLLADISIETTQITDDVDTSIDPEEYFTITTTVNGKTETENPVAQLNADGGETTVTVTVELVKTPIDIDKITGTIAVELKAAPVQP